MPRSDGAGPPGAPPGTDAGTGAVLTIDLDAVAANYRRLKQQLGSVPCAAVVKADAYGLGAERVAPTLAACGCTTFFVAHLEEGIALRRVLADARIFVLIGPRADNAGAYSADHLMPTLNSPGEIETWASHVATRGAPLQAALHIDTGMNRLGLTMRDIDRLAADPGPLERLPLALVMSHLVVAEQPAHPLNAEQLQRFRTARQRVPPLARAKASFANSSGVFLGRTTISISAGRAPPSMAWRRPTIGPIR